MAKQKQKQQQKRPAATRARPQPRAATTALIPLAAWLVVVPFVGPTFGLTLDVPLRLEIIDHVVPGVLTVGASVAALALRQRASALYAFIAAGALGTLGGLWTTSTHVPLLAQAGDGIVPWSTALFHTIPGPVVMLVALLVLVPALRAAD